jgi:hypothetical protein
MNQDILGILEYWHFIKSNPELNWEVSPIP